MHAYMYNHYTFFLKFQKFLQNYIRRSIVHLFIHTCTSLMLLLPRMREKTQPVSHTDATSCVKHLCPCVHPSRKIIRLHKKYDENFALDIEIDNNRRVCRFCAYCFIQIRLNLFMLIQEKEGK